MENNRSSLLRPFGIPIRLHSSFLLLGGGYILWQALSGGASAAASALLLGGMLFGSVALHELGHALTARAFGLRTRDITLYPFGGVAALEGEPKPGRQEALIALAGPAVNLVLAAIALPFALSGSALALSFVGLNAIMGVFNLLPAFPMDGGRVLRSWMARRSGDPLQATERALGISRWLSWGMLAIGVFQGGSLVLVGLALLWMNRQERRRLEMQRLEMQRRAQVRARRETKVVAHDHWQGPPMWSHPAV
ncbi:MAG: M50 family metallopeptidase [Myxococcota bacterium]|nr:M50 family metallopeptidase [Myxococcota bacterium]